MWGSDGAAYYPHLSAGRVGILVVPPGAGATANGSVAIFPGNASIVHALSSGGASVVGATRVLENNVVVTTLTCAAEAGGACAVTLLLSDTDSNHFGVAQDAGAAPDGAVVWWRKENLHAALNPAYAGSCDPLLPLQSVVRTFTVDASGALAMANGSCLWSDEAASPGVVTTGACAAPQGLWAWQGPPAAGDVVHVASARCLAAGGGPGGALGLRACGPTPAWSQLPAASGGVYLNATSGSGCAVVVPDNNNNTLGVVVGVSDATGNLVRGTAARVSPTNPAAGVTLTLSLVAGVEYTLLVGLQTLRDVGCAGVRPQWAACAVAPQEAAAALVRATADAASLAAAVRASDAFWAAYWAASSVDLTAGATPNATAQLGVVERYTRSCATTPCSSPRTRSWAPTGGSSSPTRARRRGASAATRASQRTCTPPCPSTPPRAPTPTRPLTRAARATPGG